MVENKIEKIKNLIFDIEDEGELYNIGNTAFMLAEYIEHKKNKKNIAS